MNSTSAPAIPASLDALVSSYLQVLAAEAPVLEQQSLQAGLRARELELSIDLIRALGGGFEEKPAAGAS